MPSLASRARHARELRAEREEVLLHVARAPHRSTESSRVARATPIAAFVSSTVPYASTRALAFGTRPPPKSPVVPSSPVFV